jgi:acyl carrier protein
MDISDLERLNEVLINYVSEIMDISRENIHDDMKPEDFENWDSFNHIKLLLTLEEDLKIKFTDEEIDSSFNLKILREILSDKIINKNN